MGKPVAQMTAQQREHKRARDAAYYAANSAHIIAIVKTQVRRPETNRNYQRSLKGRYTVHKAGAKQRGIEWLFTFKSWVEFWGDKFSMRGRGKDDLCCARRGDTGPYSPENCDIITNRENHCAYNR